VQLAGYSRVTAEDFPGDPSRPATWIEHPGATLRELPSRKVFRAKIAGRPVVIKLFTPRKLRHWLRSYAGAEANNAIAVRERGVDVVEPLAHARLPDGRQVLVLREVTGASTLKELVLSGALTGRARHVLARQMGVLFARMHNAGIQHRGPHAGNVLVKPDLTLLLADARDLRLGDYLSSAGRAKSLAVFGLFFLTHATLRDMLLFWGAYGRTSGFEPGELERLRGMVVDRFPDAFRRLAGRRARKVRRLGRPVKAGPFRGFATDALPREAVARIAERAAGIGKENGADLLKRSPTACTFRHEGEYVAKLYLPKKATRPLRDLFCGTRADRAVEAAEALRHRGLMGPEVLAVLRDGAIPTRSLLVMRKVAGAVPLEQALEHASPRAARAIAEALGRTLRRMHDWGLRQRDLKKDNLLCRTDTARPEFVFLDLDGVSQTRNGPLDWGRRAKDLGTLAGSLLDRHRVPTGLRLRALDAYLKGETPPGHAPGEFARRVAERADACRKRRLER